MCRISLFFVMAIGLLACGKEPASRLAPKPLDVQVVRGELLMSQLATEAQGLDSAAAHRLVPQLMAPMAPFFRVYLGVPPQVTDDELFSPNLTAYLLAFTQDSLTQQLLDSARAVWPAEAPLEERLQPVLGRFASAYPEAPVPLITTYISGYDTDRPELAFQDQLVYTGHQLGIGLHYFLGQNFSFYPPVPGYLRRNFAPEALEIRVAEELIRSVHIPLDPRQQPVLADHMIHAGMARYALQQLVPMAPDSLIMRWSGEELAYVKQYLPELYNHLLPSLYKGDAISYNHFIAPRPNTPGLSPDAPGKIGIYLGWQIVNAYMAQHPELSLAELLARTDYQAIMQEAGYRP